MQPIKRALLSVWDMTGLIEFASGLAKLGVEILSSGHTAEALNDAGLMTSAMADDPIVLEGMVDQAKVPGVRIILGITADRAAPNFAETCRKERVRPIDLVVVNLGPIRRIGTDIVVYTGTREQIDGGGPAILCAGARTASVTAVCNPARYARVLAEMRANRGATLPDTRFKLAHEAVKHTWNHFMAIDNYLAELGDVTWDDTDEEIEWRR